MLPRRTVVEGILTLSLRRAPSPWTSSSPWTRPRCIANAMHPAPLRRPSVEHDPTCALVVHCRTGA